MRLGAILSGLSLLLAGCSSLVSPDGKPPVAVPSGTGEGWEPPALGPVWRRLRADPPFVSALMLVDGIPPRQFADDYFDGFNATAVHFWESGLPRQLSAWEEKRRSRMRFFSWVDKDGRSRDNGQVLGGIEPDRPGRVGFQVGDEPGLKGKGFAGVLPFREGVAAVRAADPKALIVMNFNTQVGDLERILDFAGGPLGIDVFSFDRYNLGNRQYRSLELIRGYARKYHRPYWRYLIGFLKSRKDRLAASDLRWDAMSGLVYGYTGFTWFIYQSSSWGIAPAFFQEPGYGGAKSPLWQEAARINRDLAAYLRVITHLWSTDVRYLALLPVLQPEGTRPWRPGAGGNPHLAELGPAEDTQSEGMEILAGFFRDDAGEHYTMLQNVRHAGASPPNDNEDSGTVRVGFDFGAAAPSLDRSRILIFDPDTERPRSLALEMHSNRKGFARIRLDPGDVVLFKYATGRSFAGI
jgi:hypothetical protein